MAQVWSAHEEHLEQRACLETAYELMIDPGHRYMLAISLAGAARSMGELEAADAWIATLDPRPMLLDPTAPPCQRFRSCCAVASANPTVSALCGTLPQIEDTHVADQVCTQHLGAVAQVYRQSGTPLPPQCL